MALLTLVPLAFVAALFLWPVATLVTRGFVSDGQLDLTALTQLAASARLWKLIARTVGQAVVATLVATALALPTAKLVYLRRFPGRGAVRVLVTAPFVLPAVVVGLAFRALLAPGAPLGWLGLDGTFTAVVAALVFFNVGLMVRVVGSFWASLDQRPVQAARVLGASPTRAFWTVTVVQLAPAIAAGASMVFLYCATAFATVLILGGPGYGTIETEIWLQTTQLLDLRTASVLSVVQLIVVALALWLGAAARRRREAAVARPVAARATRTTCPGKGDRFAIGVAALTVVFVAAPLAWLVRSSLSTPRGFGLANYVRLVAQPVPGMSVTALDAAWLSVRIALWSTVVALAVGGAIVVVLSRRPRKPWLGRAQGVLDAVFMLPAGVSAVTVGFGLFITLDRPPLDLRASFWLIPLAQALVALPLVTRVLLPPLRAIDPRLRGAAAVLGAGGLRVFVHVDWPALRRPFAVAAGYAFAFSLGEFGATSFLARPETITLPVAVYRLMGRPGADNFGTAVAGAVLLAAVTCLVMAVAEWRREGLVTV
jgi:thiamine transport system permease protein